jgi:hypothetical protein
MASAETCSLIGCDGYVLVGPILSDRVELHQGYLELTMPRPNCCAQHV